MSGYGELMLPQLDHTIVAATDRDASALFLTEILGLEPPVPFSHFLAVETGNGVSLDYAQVDGEFHKQHYAFRVTEAEFDTIFERIKDRGLDYWADPGCSQPGEINVRDGGRGVYFPEPSGHLLEILTRSYGTGPANT